MIEHQDYSEEKYTRRWLSHRIKFIIIFIRTHTIVIYIYQKFILKEIKNITNYHD
jgi:hypothetical protein